MKKLTALLLTAALSFSLFAPVAPISYAADGEFKSDIKTHAQIFNGKTDQYAGKTVILHSNDVHGAIEGYAMIAELEDDFEEAGAEVIMVDAGDFSQGDPNVSVSKGVDAVTMMNAAGYDFVALGNHEFDYGYKQLKKNLKKAKFTVLCADILKNKKSIYDENAVYKTKDGVKIGFFGMDTPETQTKAKPSSIKGLTFYSNTGKKTEIFKCGKKQVKALKNKKADIIIGITHLGMDDNLKADGHRSVDLYKKVSGIDMIIDGHSHDVMTEGPASEPIQSTGTKFANIGVIVIDDTEKKISENYLISTEGLDKDETVEAKATKIINKIDAKFGEVIGESEVEFAAEKMQNRCYETNTGDLITDALMWQALKDKKSIKVKKDHIVAITNGGGIRAGLSVGDVTKKDIQTILPFGNTVCVVYVKGSRLLEILEASTFNLEDGIGAYPQTKGIRFTIDTTQEYDAGDAYPGTTYYKPASINRVTIKNINGKKFNKKDTYAIVTNDFVADGGDTYYPLSKCKTKFDTGITVDEVVSKYITTELKGKLTADKYGQSRGDCKQLSKEK